MRELNGALCILLLLFFFGVSSVVCQESISDEMTENTSSASDDTSLDQAGASPEAQAAEQPVRAPHIVGRGYEEYNKIYNFGPPVDDIPRPCPKQKIYPPKIISPQDQVLNGLPSEP